jgi:hypothetical protein
MASVRLWASLALSLGCLPGPLGCDPISSFDTEPGQSYCGQITLASAYRAGFSPRVQMRLTFESSAVEAGQSPGIITTLDAGDDVEPHLLLDATLRPIPALEHDALSQLQFGDGRERNLIYAVSSHNPDQEALLAVISLRSNDSVEVRLIRPGGAPGDDGAEPPGRTPMFGLFNLSRVDGDCGVEPAP